MTMTRQDAIDCLLDKVECRHCKNMSENCMNEVEEIAVKSLEAWGKVQDEFFDSIPGHIETNEDAAFLRGLDKGYEIVAKHLREVEE